MLVLLLKLLFAFLGLWLVGMVIVAIFDITQTQYWVGIFILIVLMAIGHSSDCWRKKRTVARLIDRHLKTLADKYQDLVDKDDYGNRNYKLFHAEVGYFLENVIWPEVMLSDLGDCNLTYQKLIEQITDRVERHLKIDEAQ